MFEMHSILEKYVIKDHQPNKFILLNTFKFNRNENTIYFNR